MTETPRRTGPALPAQPDDWTTPGAYPLPHGVWRIPLPLPSSGLRAVNVYATPSVDGILLVDGGWASADALGALHHGLAEIGYGLDDIARVVVTHAHHDHYTQALDLRTRHGCSVLLGRGEQASVDAFARASGEPLPQAALLRRAGAPDLADTMTAFDRSVILENPAPWGEPDQWLDDHERVAFGDRSVEIVATPGHTRGHVVLRDETAGALFAGDHVLPHITPSIGYERAPEPAPLRSFLQSLHLVRDMPEALLLPAHGPAVSSVHTRIDELFVHHEQRLDESLALLGHGASTAYEVAAGMRWTRRGHRVPDMEVEHATLAVLEIAAHLDLLVERRAAVVEENDGVARYAPS